MMKRRNYLIIFMFLLIAASMLILSSCDYQSAENSSIEINLTLVPIHANGSKSQVVLRSFEDKVVVNNYVLYLLHNGKTLYEQKLYGPPSSIISLHFFDLKQGTYVIGIKAYKDFTPIFYGEREVYLSYKTNDVEINTYFYNAKLSADIVNLASDSVSLKELEIKGVYPANATNNFLRGATFTNMEIYPGVWEIDVEATVMHNGILTKLGREGDTYELYPSEIRKLVYTIKSDNSGTLFLDCK
ncbi:MAG TPA: hypothetical protein PK574_07665 [Fervidobacterium sp.]|nr:hypothetical protein [Fervidobacterium sp.]